MSRLIVSSITSHCREQQQQKNIVVVIDLNERKDTHQPACSEVPHGEPFHAGLDTQTILGLFQNIALFC